MNIKTRQVAIAVTFCMTFQLLFTGLPMANAQAEINPEAASGVVNQPTIQPAVEPIAELGNNLVLNGGFEEGNITANFWDGGRPAGWDVWNDGNGKQHISVTEAVYHSGKRSVMISHTANDRTDLVNDTPFVSVKPGRSYTLQAWVKTRDVAPTNPSHGMYIRTQYTDANNKEIKDIVAPKTQYVRGTTDWTLYELKIDVPENSAIKGLKIETFLERGTGTIWVDDVSVREVKGITGLELQPKELKMEVGQKQQLTPITKPVGESTNELIWTSSNTVVASVYNGEVTALNHGVATIKVQTPDGGVSAESFVVVESDEMKAMYDIVREKWATKLIGGPGINMSDPVLQANVDALVKRMTDTEKPGRWDTLRKTLSTNPDPEALWDDVISKSKADSWRISWAYGIIRDLSLAYSMEGSAIKGDEQLKKDIIQALDWMNKHIYNPSKKITGNWWDWEIGTPKEIMTILTLMYKDIPEELMDRYIAVIDKFVPDPKKRVANSSTVETGANLLDKAQVVTLRGVIGKDAAKIAQGSDSILGEFKYTKSKDGLYEDGSLVQHTSIAYTGGYGAVLLGSLADIFYVLTDSPWEITDPNAANVYEWIGNNFEPLIYKGAIMDTVKGRSISRESDSDHISGRPLIMTLLRLAQSAPPDIALEAKSMIKGWVISDTTFEDYYAGLSLYELNLLKQLMQDDSIQPRGELVKTQMFAGMDRAVQLRENFGLNIGMFSDRIAAFEFGNGENKKGWYTGIGMTTLYNNDLKQFSDNYWPTIDSYRLPGTTTDGSYKEPAEWASYHNPKTWVGGTVVDDFYGSVGMEFSLSGSTGSALEGKKSWFMFDDEMVAVGSDINNNASTMTETIVENRQLAADGANQLLVNGEVKSSDLGWNEKIADVKWAHMKGNVEGSDIGYVFPSGEEVAAKREARTGKWVDINKGGSADEVTRNYLSLAIEHGNAPKAETYEYVLLPGKTPEETAAYAANPDIKVLAKTDKVHAVQEVKKQATGINFWEAAAHGYVKTDKAASVMIKENGDELTISVAEPTQKQGEVIVDLGKITMDVVAKDPRIEVVQTFPYTKLAINTQDAAGMTSSITLKVDPNQTIDMEGNQPAQGEVIELPVAEDAYVRIGENFNKPMGGEKVLEVREWSAPYWQRSFMKFDLSQITGEIDTAKLKIYGRITDNSAKPTTTSKVGAHYVSDDTWSEKEIKWDNQVSYGDLISSITTSTTAEWKEFDLSDAVKAEQAVDQTLSIGLVEHAGNGWNNQFMSKENGSNAPYLEIKTKAAELAKVTDVAITPAESTIKPGEQVKFGATVLPANAHNKQVVWALSKESQEFASLQMVDGQAVVTGLNPGTVVVMAASADGGAQATATIVVDPVAVTEISITPSEATVKQGEEVKLTATVKPADATSKGVEWSMSEEAKTFASLTVVDGQAVVMGLNPGTVEVVATAVDGSGVQARATIVVEEMIVIPDPVPVTEVVITPSETTMSQGSEVKLTASVKPDDATNKQVKWSLSEASKALAELIVVDGQAVVKGLKPGTVEVVATAVDSGVKATATIVIKADEVKPDPTPNPTPDPTPDKPDANDSIKDQVQDILGDQVKVESTEEQLKAGEVKVSIPAAATSVDFSAAAVEKLMAWNKQAKLVLNSKDLTVSIPVKKLADIQATGGVSISMKPAAEATVTSIKDQVNGLAAKLVNIADQLVIEPKGAKKMSSSTMEVGKVEQKWTIETKSNPKQLAGMRYDEARKTLVPVLMKLTKVGNGVEATFNGLPGETYVVVEANKTFSDLNQHWVKNDAEYLASKFIMQGREADAFVPQAQITRAEMAALIVRMLDLDAKASNLSYSDANDMQGKWYENDIKQVQAAGLMTGYEDGSFKPDQTITRQEIAVLVTRMMNTIQPDWSAGANASQADVFADSEDIAAWSVKEVAAAVKGGLLKGDQELNFNPTQTATRAEVAAIFKRMLDQIIG